MANRWPRPRAAARRCFRRLPTSEISCVALLASIECRASEDGHIAQNTACKPIEIRESTGRYSLTDANFTGRVANTKAYAIDMAPTGGRTDALTATRVSGSEGQGIGTHIPLG